MVRNVTGLGRPRISPTKFRAHRRPSPGRRPSVATMRSKFVPDTLRTFSFAPRLFFALGLGHRQLRVRPVLAVGAALVLAKYRQPP